MDVPGPGNGPGSEVNVSGMMKLRVSVLTLGFGVALLFAPSARAQETCPDHFTETGVEPGCPGTHVAAHATEAKPTKNAKPAASADHQNRSAAPVNVAVAVVDKKQPAVTPAPKR
jgi:hypothetical protein